MTRPDLDYLRRGSLGPLAALAVVLVLWGITATWRAQLEASLGAEQQSLAALEQERRDLQSRRDALHRYAAIYQGLAGRGLVDGDQRLLWVQALRDHASKLALPYVRYSTGPERPFEASWLVPGLSAPVMASTMEVQVGMVHEMDLFRLLDTLGQASGYFHVRTCTLERMARDTPAEADRANLTGTCQLEWFSIPREGSLAATAAEGGNEG